MFCRLGSGVVAVAVAALTAFSVMLAAGPAQAAGDPVDERVSTLGALWDALMNPGDATNIIVGDLNNNGTYDYREPQSELDSMPWMGTLIANTGGTPAQVQSGEKLAARACKTGYGCAGMLASMLGLLGLQQFGPDLWSEWVEGEFQNTLNGLPPVYYPGVRTPYTAINTAVIGANTTSAGWKLAVRGASICTSGCTPVTKIAVDYVTKDTGVWGHSESTATVNINANTDYPGFGISPYGTNTGLHTNQNLEVRRVHFVESTAGTWGFDKGWYWGQNIIPENGSMESTVRCRKTDGTFYNRTEVEPVATGLAALPACDAGDVPVYSETVLINPDGSREVQTSQKLDDGTIGDTVFPLCVSTGCKWVVKIDGDPCSVGEAGCVSWTETKNDPDTTCWYGPYKMPIAQCFWLERAYQWDVAPGTPEVPATDANTDGNPVTWDGPTPQLQPTSNPTPTQTVTTTTPPTTSPTASPTAVPTGSATPTPSVSNPTATDPATSPPPSVVSEPPGSPDPDPPADPAGARCFPQGWGILNPFEWVYKPIMCAMQDAFVPDPVTTTTRVNEIRSDLTTKGPGPVITTVTGIVDDVPSGGGCKGPAMTINLGGQSHTLYLFDACAPPMSTAAGYAHTLSSVVLVIGGGLAIVRALASAFGLNVSIGRGTGDGV